MINSQIIKKIEEFVYVKPRTVQEVSQKIGKSWRTANSYIETVSKEKGTISSRTLRGGTRGAVRIVYWNNIDKPYFSQAQERLFRQIEISKNKNDFSPFDIYQYIEDKKRSSFFEEQEEELINVKQDLLGTLRSAQEQVLFFSGNLSWASLVQGKEKLIDVFEELAKKGVSLRFLVNIDINSIFNVQKVSAINLHLGKDSVEIRHCEQPLRAFIVDNKVVKLKEIKDPSHYKKKGKNLYIFYEIYDERWIEWLQKIFWNFFHIAIPAQKRVSDLKTIKRL